MPWVDIEAKWNTTLARLSQEIELPGFRKGAAPSDMVEPRILQNLQQEVLKEIMPQALIEALQGSDIVPIDYPQYQVVSFSKGQPLVFNARVTERPKVTVGDYKTIKVDRPAAKVVADEEVEKIVDDLFKRWSARQGANAQAAATGAPQTQGATGSLSFNQTQAPANTPNDNFAKAVGGENLLDLKSKIRQDLEAEAKNESELDYEEAILQKVEGMTTVEVPEVLVQDELNRMLVSLQRRVADMGLLLDDYLKNQNKTLEGIKGEWREQAEKNVRMELGLTEIARMENVAISDDELKAEIDKIQDAKTKQQFEAEEPKMHLRHALRQAKTLNLLKTIVG